MRQTRHNLVDLIVLPMNQTFELLGPQIEFDRTNSLQLILQSDLKVDAVVLAVGMPSPL